MRDGHTRYREIQEEANGLVAWVREFVAETLDHRGRSIHADLLQMVGDLENALAPLEDFRLTNGQRAEQFYADVVSDKPFRQ